MYLNKNMDEGVPGINGPPGQPPGIVEAGNVPTITPPTTEGVGPAQESAGNNQGSANKTALPEKPKDITPENVGDIFLGKLIKQYEI